MQTLTKLAKVGTVKIEPSEDGNPYSSNVYLECLGKGAAQTLGVALRRTLLYAIPGSAFTSVQIEGASHEFTNVSGVKEDVIDIALNLKGVVLDRAICTLQVVKASFDGPREVRAGDLEEFCDGVRIVNKDYLILTITDSIKLNLRFTIESGCGYEAEVSDHPSASGYTVQKNVVGIIPIDACFCPIERVMFDIGHSRCGGVTDYDRLHLFVETNGSITPEKAVAHAARVLREQLSALVGTDVIGHEKFRDEGKQSNVHEYLNLKIEELELSVRSLNCLKNEGVVYLGDLVQYTEAQMLKMPNFGKKSLTELRNLMALYDLDFGMKVSDWVKSRKG